MSVNLSEIKSLISEIEAVFNKKCTTPSDFENLSGAVFHVTGDSISVSTLKRLWGYVPRREGVRKSTLDILSKYIGYHDFEDFSNSRLFHHESGFLTQDAISSVSLSVGKVLEVGWSPNRLCKLKYQGDGKFLILEAENTSLSKGTVFYCSAMALNHPLLLNILSDNQFQKTPYIAGKKTGLTVLRVLSNDQP